jgi:alanyl-tRNA synthetase
MRRAMRHAQLLGAADPLMWRLVPALVREMGQAYPELVRGEPLITETLKLEERRFRKTLARGLSLLADATEEQLPAGVRMRVLLGDEAALLPDLESIEAMIADALAAVA